MKLVFDTNEYGTFSASPISYDVGQIDQSRWYAGVVEHIAGKSGYLDAQGCVILPLGARRDFPAEVCFQSLDEAESVCQKHFDAFYAAVKG